MRLKFGRESFKKLIMMIMNAEIKLQIVTTSSTVNKLIVKSLGSTVRQSVSGINTIV